MKVDHDKLQAKFFKLLHDRQEEWMATVMAKEMPPELFLRAYGNKACRQEIIQWLVDNGYYVCFFQSRPFYLEIRKGDKVIASTNLIPK